ncbi:MmgE/PrpD family protein [Alcaligenaceae bacterium C4P045]|nr:MmgE/PrpD family protein [Alcaligenaceae bacterium C4P045]
MANDFAARPVPGPDGGHVSDGLQSIDGIQASDVIQPNDGVQANQGIQVSDGGQVGDGINAARAAAANAFSSCLRRIAACEWRDLPVAARSRAAMIMADNMAAAFSAADEPEVVRARDLALREGDPGAVTMLARGRPLASRRDAASINGLTMGWNELDEGYRKAVCHGGLYVLPALLATAEACGASGRDVLRALILGYEIVARVARAWRFPDLRLHPHALLGPVGAAAGVALLRRLPPDELIAAVAGATALGMAGPFNQAVQGALVRNTWAAHGAVAGMAAVDHARAGIGGLASTPFDVYVTGLGTITDLSAFDDDGDWAVCAGYQKINACCQYAHSSIAAVQALIARTPKVLKGAAVNAVRVAAHPLALKLDNRQPLTTLAAKFSLPHAVAAAIVHGHGGVTAFDSASLSDPRIERLRQLIEIVPFDGVRPAPHDRPAAVEIETAAGTDRETCWSAPGGPDLPFDEQDINRKVAALCAPVAPAAAGVLERLAQMAVENTTAPTPMAAASIAAARSPTPDASGSTRVALSLSSPWSAWLDAMFAEPQSIEQHE